MATQKVRSELHPPDDRSSDRQPRNRGRTIAVLVAVAFIVIAGVALVLIRDDPEPPRTDQGTANSSADAGPTVAPEGEFAIYDIAARLQVSRGRGVGRVMLATMT